MVSLSSAPRYDRWKAPAEDGRFLLWPAAPELLAQTLQNQAALRSADAVRIHGVPLPEVRQRLREWLGHPDASQPLIATGHQTELHHPGVWAKNALIDAVAHKVGGRAVHIAVDTDAPKHLRLRWPGGSAELTDPDDPPAAWSGQVPAPTPARLATLLTTFDAAASSWDFSTLVSRFMGTLRRESMNGANLSAALTDGNRDLDQSLGLGHETAMMSPICWSEPYLLFVHHVLARADAFIADYNGALDEFRRENKIRVAGRPMPNLKCSASGCEVPFWLDDLAAGTRERAAVLREEKGYSLVLRGGERFYIDPDADGWTAAGKLMLFLRRNGARLSPRALTLTSVLRLLVADQFVHGIGGGQYDQVLDKLIARHFGMEPPRFSVTTATLYFPGAAGRPRVCLPCIARDGHRLRHAILGAAKMELVRAIERAPRRSAERSQIFYSMHEELARAMSLPQFASWERELDEARGAAQKEKVLFDRELFYALQPPDRLRQMIGQYRGAIGVS